MTLISCSEVKMNFIGQTLALDSSGMNSVVAALNVQPQKKSQTIVEEPQLMKQLQEVVEHLQLEKPRGDRMEASTHTKTSNRGNFKPGGQRDHMQPYL